MNEPTSAFRPEIQGLRAVAVLVVLVFHVWPAVLPGGYVGVDVFFVISGYLITSLLLKEAEARGTISLRGFYTRRIKRLLPAATCTLLAAATATALLPEDQRGETAFELAASALYAQNFWLAQRARDYLAADDAPSILQHFWSLSVEEQYYIVWPLLLLLVMRASAAARARPRAVFEGLVVAIFIVSLAHSIRSTAIEAATAYFSTFTRAWELALGGALAVFPGWRALPDAARALAGLVGLTAIGVASRSYDAGTAFPGYAALLPTLGAALVLVSGAGSRLVSADKLLESRAMQYLGDISYSLYLWHWLVVTVYSARVDRELGLLDGSAIVLLSIVLAHFSKRFVEDPFRRADVAARSPWRPFAVAGVCIAASLVAASIVYAFDVGLDERVVDGDELLGARALRDPSYDWKREDPKTVVPSPRRAIKDLPSAYAEGCLQKFRGSTVKKCLYGSKKAKRSLVLIGDSHAAHWFPALEELASRHRVRAYGIAKSACAFSLDPVYDRTVGRPYRECVEWSRRVIKWLAKERPDLVLIAQSPRHKMGALPVDSDTEAVGRGMAKAWEAVTRLRIELASFETTPWFPGKRSTCLSESDAWQRECALPRSSVIPEDPVDVAAALTKTRRVDMNDAICVGDLCPPIIGGVLVYRDAHHLTATYARTLAPELHEVLVNQGLWPK